MHHPLESLQRQHHALLPPYLLRLPSPTILAAEESQKWMIQHILHDPALGSYTPERGYNRSFWRKIVAELEKGVEAIRETEPDSEVEVDEVFYELLADLMVSSPSSSDLPQQSYRTFVYDRPAWTGQTGESRVTLLEEQVAIQAGTTGLRTWTASLHLAHHILTSPTVLFPDAPSGLPPCVELGAGTGFLSILLAQLGADVIATDLDGPSEGARQAPLDRLRGNARLNDSAKSLQIEALDWTDALLPFGDRPPIWQGLTSGSSRTVVAADVIYDPSLVPPLVAAIDALVGSSSHAIISATVRNPTTLDLFVETCHKSGLELRDLDLVPMPSSDPTFWDSALDAGSNVRIMRIRRPHV
ncbi:hypothetical protein DB88DRAFT_489232 [Papiliotrema laurentii]|uniref:Uncharacterized protein n=1 Tax=Papiliotrema laurentii TaxID=5418 RepID=A0AAD9FQP7_PAPLA|nr:hypothetical protein DB88DRAFT_489232 [Papiliotrema laurentii]